MTIDRKTMTVLASPRQLGRESWMLMQIRAMAQEGGLDLTISYSGDHQKLEAVKALRDKIGIHAHRDRAQGLPASDLLAQIALDLSNILDGE